MSLNTFQYDSIMREYDDIQSRNRRIHNERLAFVYRNVEGYEELDKSIPSLAKKRLFAFLSSDSEDPKFRAISGEETNGIISKKHALLKKAALSEDYLDPIFDCPLCQDTGYVTTESGTEIKCSCFKRREIQLLYKNSNLRYMGNDNGFSKIRYDFYQGEDLNNFKKAVETARNFVLNFEQDYTNIIFYGTVGTGKSFLSGCIAREILNKGYSVIYYSSAELFELLVREAMGKIKSRTTLEDVTNCDLLIIDDLGTEVSNTLTGSELFTLLNTRDLLRKPTIISSNLSLKEIRDVYSDRVFSRLASNYTFRTLTGPDVRLLLKKSIMSN